MSEHVTTWHQCHVCSKPTSTRCSSCKSIYYCDTTCQHKDWKRHKKQCKKINKQISQNISKSNNVNINDDLKKNDISKESDDNNERRYTFDIFVKTMNKYINKTTLKPYYNDMNCKTVSINVSYDDTILSIKQQYHDKEGVPPEQQTLMFLHKRPNVILEDNKFVRDYDIQRESTIHVGFDSPDDTFSKETNNNNDDNDDNDNNDKDDTFDIFVETLTGTVFTIHGVAPNDTILSIKQKLQDKSGIPTEQQKLKFREPDLSFIGVSSPGCILENNKLVSDYCIKKGSKLDLTLRLRAGVS